MKLQVWDTAGQERFKTITTAYYRGAMGILLVYDVCDEKSFNSKFRKSNTRKNKGFGLTLVDIHSWYANVQQHASDSVVMILVGNKSDMTDRRVVSTEQGQALADELGIPFLEASAKNNENVEESFFSLSRRVKENMYSGDAGVQPGNGAGNSVNVNQGSGGGVGSKCC